MPTSTPSLAEHGGVDPDPIKRWGYLKGEVNYKQIAEQVFLLTDAKKTMKQLGMPA